MKTAEKAEAMKAREISENFSLDNVIPFFQPVMDVSDNVVWSYECLARLVTQQEQTFLPSEFLNLVEEGKCEGKLTQRIFHSSAQYFRNSNTGWSINISEQDVLNSQTMDFLRDYLRHYPNARRVSLELMADTVTKHPDAFHTFLHECKQLNLKLFVDHVPDVPSNYAAIMDLPIDGIKIDASYLVKLIKHRHSRALLRKLRQKARKNNIAIVAEHVEDQETLDVIADLDIQYAQGFYFSQPSRCAN